MSKYIDSDFNHRRKYDKNKHRNMKAHVTEITARSANDVALLLSKLIKKNSPGDAEEDIQSIVNKPYRDTLTSNNPKEIKALGANIIKLIHEDMDLGEKQEEKQTNEVYDQVVRYKRTQHPLKTYNRNDDYLFQVEYTKEPSIMNKKTDIILPKDNDGSNDYYFHNIDFDTSTNITKLKDDLPPLNTLKTPISPIQLYKRTEYLPNYTTKTIKNQDSIVKSDIFRILANYKGNIGTSTSVERVITYRYITTMPAANKTSELKPKAYDVNVNSTAIQVTESEIQRDIKTDGFALRTENLTTLPPSSSSENNPNLTNYDFDETLFKPNDWTPIIHNLPRTNCSIRKMGNDFVPRSINYQCSLLQYSLIPVVGCLACLLVLLTLHSVWSGKYYVKKRPTRRQLFMLKNTIRTLALLCGCVSFSCILVAVAVQPLDNLSDVYMPRTLKRLLQLKSELKQQGLLLNNISTTMSPLQEIIAAEPLLLELEKYFVNTIARAQNGTRLSNVLINSFITDVRNAFKDAMLMQNLLLSAQILFWFIIHLFPLALAFLTAKYRQRRIRLLKFVKDPILTIVIICWLTAAIMTPSIISVADMCHNFTRYFFALKLFPTNDFRTAMKYYASCKLNGNNSINVYQQHFELFADVSFMMVDDVKNTVKSFEAMYKWIKNTGELPSEPMKQAMTITKKLSAIDLEPLMVYHEKVGKHRRWLFDCKLHKKAIEILFNNLCNKCPMVSVVHVTGMMTVGFLLTILLATLYRLRRLQTAILIIPKRVHPSDTNCFCCIPKTKDPRGGGDLAAKSR